MEIPKKKDLKKEHDGIWLDYQMGFNDCHDQFTKAIIERLEKIQVTWRYMQNTKVIESQKIDELINELHQEPN